MKGLVKLAVDSHEYIIRVLIRKIIIKGDGVGNVEVVKLTVGWALMKIRVGWNLMVGRAGSRWVAAVGLKWMSQANGQGRSRG